MRRSGHLVSSLALLAALALSAPARADVLLLKAGGRIEGEVVSDGAVYRVHLPSGAWVEVPGEEVLSVERGGTFRDEYIRGVNALDPTDAEGHYRLGLHCKEHGLATEAEALFRRAVTAVPDHDGARAALSEVFFDGRWMPEAEAYERQGLVRHAGRWVTPEEKTALVWRERVRICAAEVRRLSQRVRSPDPTTAADAKRALSALDDPAACEPLLEASEHWHEDVRLASIPALARRAAEEEERVSLRLARLASHEPDLSVQDAAADEIAKRKLVPAAEELLRAYVEEDAPYVRKAAAHALGRIRYKPAFGTLWTTLYFTVRRQRLVPVPYWTATMRPISPAVRESFGVRRSLLRSHALQAYDVRVVDDTAWNGAARDALRGLTGVDYDYDKTGWWNWWVDREVGFGTWMEPAPGAPEGPGRS